MVGFRDGCIHLPSLGLCQEEKRIEGGLMKGYTAFWYFEVLCFNH